MFKVGLLIDAEYFNLDWLSRKLVHNSCNKNYAQHSMRY